MWNRQRTDEVLLDVNDVALGHAAVMRWNPADRWITSKEPSHEPLIKQDIVDQAQEARGRRARQGTPHRQHRTRHPYVFRGSVYCAVCERRMQGQHSNGAPYYRSRYTREYAAANRVEHPSNVYLREDVLVNPIVLWLASAFSPTNLDHTVTAMAKAQPVDTATLVKDETRRAIASCDSKLKQYRAALDAGADPVVVTGWIADTQAVPAPRAGHRGAGQSASHDEGGDSPDRRFAGRHRGGATRRLPGGQGRGLPAAQPQICLRAKNENGARHN
ncbi:zinc ribbon domain-containing protein [Actinoplanes ianthinogenes]|uniref:zinc ribbon domain-containing protein n=1 Tax=Actinoplanes ianthinogenes TaxID=122358 RepID=UPI00167169AC|nr:zinc ribbon domain-containing protein [Actinoplanes ianthinogenes]